MNAENSGSTNMTGVRIGIAGDHAGFELKVRLRIDLENMGYSVEDFGPFEEAPDDDYPDYVIPLAQAVAEGRVERGIALCGSGVGACIAANKVAGARAALVHETFSARQGVEDDDMNIICLGGRVVGYEMARELVSAFLKAHYSGASRFQKRLDKITALEKRR